MKDRLQKYENEKQEYLHIREEERLNAYGMIDIVLDGMDKLRHMLSKQKTK